MIFSYNGDVYSVNVVDKHQFADGIIEFDFWLVNEDEEIHRDDLDERTIETIELALATRSEDVIESEDE